MTPPAVQSALTAALAEIARAFSSDFIGPKLPHVSEGAQRYPGVWMPPVSAYIRANQRGEHMTYPARYGRGLPMGDA